MGPVWDDATIFKLLDTFKSQRILWDCASWSKDYKNKLKKNDAWEDIAATMGMSKMDVESKMHTLRSQFARERKKILSLKNTGVEDTEISRWKFYDAMKFLSSGVQRTSSERPDVVVKTENPNDVLEIELTDNSMTSSRSTPEPQTSQPPSTKVAKRKIDDNSHELNDNFKQKRRTDDGKDEFDIYGQYVASELRETADEYSTLKAKSFINDILFQMRTGNYKIDQI